MIGGALLLLTLIGLAAGCKLHVIDTTVQCSLRLRAIHGEYFQFAAENSGAGPLETPISHGGVMEFASTNAPAHYYFRTLLNRYGVRPEDLTCPNDSRRPAPSAQALANSNISYFISLDPANRIEVLAGNRNISTLSGTNLLLSPATAAWQPSFGLHGREGNIAFADGSVKKLNTTNLVARLKSLQAIPKVMLP